MRCTNETRSAVDTDPGIRFRFLSSQLELRTQDTGQKRCDVVKWHVRFVEIQTTFQIFSLLKFEPVFNALNKVHIFVCKSTILLVMN